MRYSPGDFVLGFQTTIDGDTEARVSLAKGRRWLDRPSLLTLRKAVVRPLGISEVNLIAADAAETPQELFSFLLPRHIGEDAAEEKICLAIARTAPRLKSLKPYRRLSKKSGSRHVNRLHAARNTA